MKLRAGVLRSLRAFLDERGVVEVTTPVLGRTTVPDLHIDSLRIKGRPGGWLQTSPEYFMKRMLAAGAGPIYQLGPVFRAGERGDRHNVEFTLLEWYRPDLSLEDLMHETVALITRAFEQGGVAPLPVVEHSYRELFEAHFGINPHAAPLTELVALAASHCPESVGHIETFDDDATRNDYLDVLFTHTIEPALSGLTFVVDFPATQAALATTAESGGDRVARRFECYVGSMELANAYDELCDAAMLRKRFEQQNAWRKRRGKSTVDIDENLLDAVDRMPRASGIALGVDRLVMAIAGAGSIDEVIPFSSPRL